jgi:hypothetical protein
MAQPDSTYVLYNRQTGSYEVSVVEETIWSGNKNFLYLNTRTNHIIPSLVVEEQLCLETSSNRITMIKIDIKCVGM